MFDLRFPTSRPFVHGTCPDDPGKVDPGACDCGMPDTDTDADGTLDCNDGCPGDANKLQPGTCGCGTPDDDADADGTPDCTDACPADPINDVLLSPATYWELAIKISLGKYTLPEPFDLFI